MEDKYVIRAGLEQHGHVIVVGVGEDSLKFGHDCFILEQQNVEGVSDLFELVNVHPFHFEPQRIHRVGILEFVIGQILLLIFLVDLQVIQFQGFHESINFIFRLELDIQGEGIGFAVGDQEGAVVPHIFEGAGGVLELNEVFDLVALGNANVVVLNFTLINIILLITQNNIPLEDVLALRSQHAHFAYQHMRHVFTLRHVRVADYGLAGLFLFLDLHQFVGVNHSLDLELFGVFDFEVVVAPFWDVDLAVEIIDVVLVDVGRIDDFYFFVGEIEIFLSKCVRFGSCLGDLITWVFTGYLTHFLEADFLQKRTLHTLIDIKKIIFIYSYSNAYSFDHTIPHKTTLSRQFDQFFKSLLQMCETNSLFRLYCNSYITIMASEEKGFLRGFPKIEQGSDQWKIIDFKLQLSLGTSAVLIKNIYDISNTHLSSAFSSNAKGSIILESFLPTEQLNENNKLFKVCTKGYQFSEEGRIFTVGFNQIRDSKKEMSCIMNKIAVGKSYCYNKNTFLAKPITCPEAFQSVYLYNEEQNPQVFKHQYVVYKNYQVLPVYVIDYSVNTDKEQMAKAPLCDNCTKVPPEPAKTFCVTEDAHFCQECDQDYHASKIASKHQRVEIADKPKTFGHCEKHDPNELELYCSVCSEALCVNCKIFGNHMSGEMARHPLIKLKDAYSQISSKVKEMDPNIERRKNQLTDDLSNIDMKIKQINERATKIQEELYASFQRALKDLQTETQKKLSFLICDQLQLKRQYDHILWMDGFIKHQLEIQSPHEFLNSWYKFSKYKKEVLSLSNLSINTEVKADMKMEGEIKIIVEGKSKSGNQNIDKQLAHMNEYSSPVKTGNQATADKELGSTQLRKTIFKKHYSEKMKEMGQQPSMIKGSMSTLNKVNQDYK